LHCAGGASTWVAIETFRKEPIVTFEEANAAVDRAVASGSRTRTKALTAAATGGGGGGPLNQICSVYAIIKPILQGLESIPFFPGNWKKVIDDFISVLDRICPAGTKAAAGKTAASFEELDKQVKSALTAYWNQSAKPMPLTARGIDLDKIAKDFCGVYKPIKPILEFAQLFAPAAWKAGIIAFELVGDAICSPAGS
jgi:hypothetical protein